MHCKPMSRTSLLFVMAGFANQVLLGTIFSAPLYPQHCPRNNDAAVLQLEPTADGRTLKPIVLPMRAANRPEVTLYTGSDLPLTE